MSMLRRSPITAFAILLFSLVVPVSASSSGTAAAHCVSNNNGSNSGITGAVEYNQNYGTCDFDTVYTGRFCDTATDGIRIKMWNSTSGYSSASNAQACGFLWTYNDNNSSSTFRICQFTLSLSYIGCGATGSDYGH